MRRVKTKYYYLILIHDPSMLFPYTSVCVCFSLPVCPTLCVCLYAYVHMKCVGVHACTETLHAERWTRVTTAAASERDL